MLKKKRYISLDTLHLSNPQKVAVAQLLSGQKNKYKRLLHETHERLHIITDSAFSLELWIDTDGAVEFVSPACLTVTGYAREEFLQRSVVPEDLIDATCRAQFLEDRQRVLEDRVELTREYLARAKDGSPRHLLGRWLPVATRRDRIVGYRLSLLDLTAQRRAEEHGVLLAEALRHVIEERAGTAVFLCDPDGLIRAANRAAEQVTGRKRAELHGREAAELLPEFGALLRRVASDDAAPASVIAACIGRDGAAVPGDAVLRRLPGDTGNDALLLLFRPH
jgi:PAS domain S-box-containing protein